MEKRRVSLRGGTVLRQSNEEAKSRFQEKDCHETVIWRSKEVLIEWGHLNYSN